MFNPDDNKQPDTTFLRAVALNILSTLRDDGSIDKEQFFADAIAFYRWFFTHVKDKSEMHPYTRVFALLHPKLLSEARPSLQEACFISWFVANGFDQLEFLSENEIERYQWRSSLLHPMHERGEYR